MTEMTVWETSEEIPYWWRVTTQIKEVLLIGWSKFRTRHDQLEALPRFAWVVTRHQYDVISMEFSSVTAPQTSIRWETSDSVSKLTDCFLRLIAAIYRMAELQSYLQNI